MSTLSAPSPAPPPVVESSPTIALPIAHDTERIVLRGLSWSTFRRILDETGNKRRARLAYTGGDLEIMSPGPRHEEESSGFDAVIKIVCEEAEIDFKGFGSTTWHRDEAERGIEADECYYFAAEKLAAAGEASRRGSNDSTEYPIPDPAIEIDMRRSALDRAEVYATLGVPEVWSYEEGRLHIFGLGDDRIYREVDASRFLPISPADLARWADEFERSDNERLWARDGRAWVRAELAKRG